MMISLLITEISIVIIAFLGQLSALFMPDKTRCLVVLTSLTCFVVAIYSYFIPHLGSGFEQSFVNDNIIYKPIIILLVSASLIIYASSPKSYLSYEFVTLVLLSTTGICFAISSRHFLLLFTGLELQSLCAYALTIIGSSNSRASEAALKYLILGALVSAMSLLGISFIYGATNSLYFSSIASTQSSLMLTSGLVLMSSYVLFKLAAAPLHIWLIDVYEGASTSIVSYFATAQKFGMVVILIILIKFTLSNHWQAFMPLLQFLAVTSMIIGALGASVQNSFKRLMAYSSILNIGYVLMILTINSNRSYCVALVYIIIYVSSVLGLFASTYFLFSYKSDSLTMRDLRGIGQEKPFTALAITILVLSNIGLPPLAGFIGKYYLFTEMINNQNFKLLAISLFASFVSAYYYLRIIKIMYFENSDEVVLTQNNQKTICNIGLKIVIITSTGFNLIAFFLPIESLINYL